MKLESYIPAPQTLEELKMHFMYLSRMVDEDSNFRKLLYFLTFQMEWSNGLLNSFRDLFDEFRARPRNTILNVLSAEQNRGKIAASVDINSLARTIHCLWHGLMWDKLSQQESVCFANELNFGFDLIINALVKTKD